MAYLALFFYFYIYSQWTKHYRYIYHTTGFDPTYCSKTKYCMRQSVAQVTAGCNKQNVVFNNGLLELQPAVMLQFCNITAGCYLNHWSLHTIFCLLSVCWIKINGICFVHWLYIIWVNHGDCILSELITVQLNRSWVQWEWTHKLSTVV